MWVASSDLKDRVHLRIQDDNVSEFMSDSGPIRGIFAFC
jgi:hypothetical protein